MICVCLLCGIPCVFMRKCSRKFKYNYFHCRGNVLKEKSVLTIARRADNACLDGAQGVFRKSYWKWLSRRYLPRRFVLNFYCVYDFICPSNLTLTYNQANMKMHFPSENRTANYFDYDVRNLHKVWCSMENNAFVLCLILKRMCLVQDFHLVVPFVNNYLMVWIKVTTNNINVPLKRVRKIQEFTQNF